MKLHILPLEKHFAILLSPAFMMCTVTRLWGISSTDGLAGDILGLSSFPQNLWRAEMFLSKSERSLNRKIWKWISSSWMLLCFSTKCWHISWPDRHLNGTFLAFISAGGVYYMKEFVMNLKLRCAKLIECQGRCQLTCQ